MNTGDRIKQRRLELGLTADELGKKIGKSRATIYRYENGDIENMPTPILEPLATALQTTPADLMGWDITNATSGYISPADASLKSPSSHSAFGRGVKINVVGRVAAGIPIEAIENIIDTEEIPEEMAKTGKFFGLRIAGDSMEPDIHNGDTVIVRRQPDAENDEIVVALVNGHDGVCKRLKKYSDSIALVSSNPAYEPKYFNKDEIEQTPVSILGKVVELRRKF